MSKESFQYWKELVGLENTDFPQLIDLTDDTIDRATIVPTRLSPIKAAIAANSLVSIQVQPGWGGHHAVPLSEKQSPAGQFDPGSGLRF